MIGVAAAMGVGGGAEAEPAAPMTNHPNWIDGKPAPWPDMKRLEPQVATLYRPTTEWTYSHHPHLGWFAGRYHAIWSNGRIDEDAPGQRVLWATSRDGLSWTEAAVLAEPTVRDGKERILTAAGFLARGRTLTAYFAEYGEPDCADTRLFAVTSRDGKVWSKPADLGVPVCPNHGPHATRSGRLIIAGNIAFPYTDDRTGLNGWHMAGVYGEPGAFTKDDPHAFWGISKQRGWPTALCEGSFLQTADGTLRMLLRSTGPGFRHRLWYAESRDDGAHWSDPVEADFSDCNTKFHLGKLPDGRFTYVGSPLAGSRCPLVVSTSRDGLSFDRHFDIGRTPYAMSRPGRWKGGEYGYPHSLVRDGRLWVIVSRQKEGVEVLGVPLEELTRHTPTAPARQAQRPGSSVAA